MTGDDIVAAARTWIDTPFHDQARVKGVGCDCIGLIRGVASELGIEFEGPHNYSRVPNPSLLWSAISDNADLVAQVGLDERKPGDVLLFKVRRDPQHFAFMSGEDTMIHAYDGARVCETTFLKWVDQGKLLAVYRFAGVT